MPNIKKIVVSGSGISQLTNDAGYIASLGGGIVSSSAQIASDISGAFTATFTAYTSSNDSKVNSLTSATSSYALATNISVAFTATSGGFSTIITTL